jgi:hypothetical protein
MLDALLTFALFLPLVVLLFSSLNNEFNQDEACWWRGLNKNALFLSTSNSYGKSLINCDFMAKQGKETFFKINIQNLLNIVKRRNHE